MTVTAEVVDRALGSVRRDGGGQNPQEVVASLQGSVEVPACAGNLTAMAMLLMATTGDIERVVQAIVSSALTVGFLAGVRAVETEQLESLGRLQ